MHSKKLLKLRDLIWMNKWHYLGAIVLMFMSILFYFVSPLLLGETVDYYLLGGESRMPGFINRWVDALGGPEFMARNLWIVGLALIITYLLSGACDFFKGRWQAISGENIAQGDMTELPFADGSFDAVISECAFSVCGDTEKAFSEAHRVLKSGGFLLISDVYFKTENAPCLSLQIPAAKEGWEQTADGFKLKAFHDRTKVWTEFMIHCIWNGLDLGDCGYFKSAAKAKGGYFIAAWEKEDFR